METEELGAKTSMARGGTNLAAGVAPEEKGLRYGSRNQKEGSIWALKALQTNLSGPTGLVAWEGSVKVWEEGRM